jgi:hypothetical protein
MALGREADQVELPDGLEVGFEMAWRQESLVILTEEKAVLEARAEEWNMAEKAEYEATLREREEKAQQTGSGQQGELSRPPTAGSWEKDQRSFSDPGSRIIKGIRNLGFDQHYSVQLVVDQDCQSIVGQMLLNHGSAVKPIPTLKAILDTVGKPRVAALEHVYWNPTNAEELEAPGIEPYLSTGRYGHYLSWREPSAQRP